jgi:DNA-binding winged helix-turn-helix (wHTH) protein/predicted ATPase
MLFTFHEYVLDTQRHELRQQGVPVPLERKVYEVLVYLVQQADRLVTKHELLEAVWPAVYVNDSAVARCIGAVRQAVGDGRATQRVIRTVHGQGYRFVAPVVVHRDDAGTSPPVALAPPAPLASPGSPVPLVGRAAEVAQLHACFAQAQHGARQLVFVTGEAGIGKTTVVDAFLAQVEAALPVWIGRGQCIVHYGAGEAYLPLLEALGRLGRGPDGARLVACLRQYAPTWLVQLPALCSPDALEALRHAVQGMTRERMLRELAEALEVLATEHPVVLVLEDLHWSDVSTVDTLALLARRREAARLMVLGTYRPVELILREHPLEAVKQELQLHGHCADLALGPLPVAEVAAYLAQRVPAGAATAELAAWVHRRTEGHPLFMVHVVDDLARQGRLTNTAAVPAGLQPLIEMQLGRLSAEVQQVLEVASVAGVEFAVASVAAGLPLAFDAIERICEALVRQGQFIADLGLAEWPDGTVSGLYGFRHALYQEVLYRRIGSARRARVHQAIGARLEAGYGASAPQLAAELAMHFAHGRDLSRAVQYCSHAAQRAIQRHAHREALAHVEHGLALLPHVPNSVARAQLELGLQTARGVSLAMSQGFGTPDVEHAYRRAHALCQDVVDVPVLFPVLCGLWNFFLARADFPRVTELADRLLALAQHQPEPALLIQAHTMQGQTRRFVGDLETAILHLDQSLTLYDAGQHRRLLAQFGEDPAVICHNYAALTCWLLGALEQAQRHLDAGRRLARELARPLTVAQDLWRGAIVLQCRGDVNRVADDAEALIGLCRDEALSLWQAGGVILQGWARARQGQGDEGIALLHQGLQDWRATGTEVLRPYYLALCAEAYGEAKQPEAGLRALTEALALIKTTGERWYEAELYRLQGELTLQCHAQGLASGVRQRRTAMVQQATHSVPDPQTAAEACFHQALEVARRQQARSLELRAALSLSRLWQQQGKRDEVRALLAPIYGWFTEGLDTADLLEAKAVGSKNSNLPLQQRLQTSNPLLG